MDMKTICQNQVEEAKKHKWIMGEKLGKDPGNAAIEEWVNKYAKIYRQEFNACFMSLVQLVSSSLKDKIKEKCPEMKDDDIIILVQMIVEQFTIVWTKECAINESEVHLKEI
jgi:hypothetical protein